MAATKSLDGREIARALLAGRPVVRSETVIHGPVDLEGADVVPGLFRCRGCTFRGRFAASDVTFARTLDLSGSTFRRSVDFRGATFRAPALFSSVREARANEPEDRSATFERGADFSVAVFDNFVTFKRSTFDGPARFRDTRFGDANFAHTTFGAAAFDGASFRGAARFNDALFDEPATFDDADFRARTDFSTAQFSAGGKFIGAQFAAGASFLDSHFTSSRRVSIAGRFDSATAAGNLNFTFGEFVRGKDAVKSGTIASFADLVCAGSLVLSETTFGGTGTIAMDRIQVRELIMELEDVARIEEGEGEERRAVLETIEQSAKERGDLAYANDAHYELRVLESEDYSTLGHALDFVFYRGVAGYFVRPVRPLLVLVALVLIAALIRALRDPSGPGGQHRRLRRLSSSGRHRAGVFATSVLNTFSLVGPRRGGDDPELAERLETLTYRLLAVCVLLGLANSNPTLRQMVDTLF